MYVICYKSQTIYLDYVLVINPSQKCNNKLNTYTGMYSSVLISLHTYTVVEYYIHCDIDTSCIYLQYSYYAEITYLDKVLRMLPRSKMLASS